MYAIYNIIDGSYISVYDQILACEDRVLANSVLFHIFTSKRYMPHITGHSISEFEIIELKNCINFYRMGYKEFEELRVETL